MIAAAVRHLLTDGGLSFIMERKLLFLRLSKKSVIARRPNGPTWQSVPKTHKYQHISDFWVTDSHVASLLGMTEKGLSTR